MDPASRRLVIGALSARTGSRVETIRYYEHVGLLPGPPRSAGGYRLYGLEHLKRLVFILRARALHFSIQEVRRLLTLADERRRPCAEAKVLATAHLAQVRTKLADLRTMERVLAKTVARCDAGTGSDCPLIEALYEAGPAGSEVEAAISGPRRRAAHGTGRQRAPAGRASGRDRRRARTAARSPLIP